MSETLPLYGLDRTEKDPLAVGKKIAARIMQDHRKYASYTTDLQLEALLYFYDATQAEEYLDHVLKVWQFREEKNADRLNLNLLFTCLHFETYLRTGDEKYLEGFLEGADRFMNEWPRNPEGILIMKQHPEQERMLLDMLQGFTVFMARAGWLSGDEKYYRECIRQYRLYREKLRNPSTGLWHQGNHWSRSPEEVSPGHWNRAQGWLIRGLVDCLDYLPDSSPYWIEVWEMLLDLVFYLKKYQDARGMWHQLTDRQDAYPETSGSAMFVHYIWKAIHRDWLDDVKYKPMVTRGLDALLGFVHSDGTVSNTSLGTGPLPDEEGYLHRPAIPGDPHGTATMLMACAIPHATKRPGDKN